MRDVYGMTTLAERVDLGATLLDEKKPGWHEEINTDTLAIHLADHCICGQLFGSFIVGRQFLGIPRGGGDQYGFNAPQNSYTDLKNLWVEAIDARKLGALVEEKELIGV